MKHPLQKYLDENNEAVAAFAERTGTSRQTIYRIIKGEARPSADMIKGIMNASGGTLTFDDLYRETAA